MSLVTLVDAYSIGNEEIDSHHKKLFDMFNALYVSAAESDDGTIVYALLDELLYYSDYHFKAEEQLMIENNYVDTAMHMVRHKYFIDAVMDLRRSEGVSSHELAKETVKFLGNWLLLHVTKEDSKIAVYFQDPCPV